MKKLLISFTAVIAFLFVAPGAFAADTPLKIGVIDLQKIMLKSSQVAAISSQLEKRFKPKQQAILADRKSVQEQADKLARNATTMSEAERTKLQTKIIAERANLQTT